MNVYVEPPDQRCWVCDDWLDWDRDFFEIPDEDYSSYVPLYKQDGDDDRPICAPCGGRMEDEELARVEGEG